MQPLNRFPELVIVASGDRPASIENWHYIYGEVRNDTGGVAKYIKIVVTGYNALGTVVMVDHGYTSQAELIEWRNRAI